MSAQRPDRRRLAVWEAYIFSHTVVMRALERELQHNHEISLAEYDVLLHLYNAPDQRLRMGELAEGVLFSTGGLSRLLDRLERDGLVARERTLADRRGVYAALTEAGRLRVLQANETHLHGIQGHFASALYDDEVEPVGRFLGRLRTRDSAAQDESCTTDSEHTLS